MMTTDHLLLKLFLLCPGKITIKICHNETTRSDQGLPPSVPSTGQLKRMSPNSKENVSDDCVTECSQFDDWSTIHGRARPFLSAQVKPN